MPPRARSSKLSLQDQYALIRKYKISIEGPIRRQYWPPKYAAFFALVQNMERIRYDEYRSTHYSGDDARVIARSNMRSRVGKLVTKAYAVREALDNEETWRMEIENLILERFDTEVDCRVCLRRRWISDLQAIPNCEGLAERLQTLRRGRRLCICSELERAMLTPDHTTQKPFVAKASCTFVDRSMVEIQQKELTHHKPDRVYGLGLTDELEQLLAARAAAGPVLENNGMYSPFLILEAKAEKNSVGFKSIEQQTVFPIRAMLNLQNTLMEASNVEFNPLVWFLANQGDEWRIYACFPDCDRTRVIDLWHGSILRHDSALQLLLIVDMLRDWAKDIFEAEIMSILRKQGRSRSVELLSRSSVDILELSPPPPTIKPKQCQPAHSSLADLSISDIQDVSMDEASHGDTDDDLPATGIGSPSPDPSAPLPHLSEDHEARKLPANSWTNRLALRSGLDVKYQFSSISLPESVDELSVVFEGSFRFDTVNSRASELLNVLSKQGCLTAEPSVIDEIRRMWIGDQSEQPSRKSDSLVYAFLLWHADFTDNWDITSELMCITASPSAIEALATLANGIPRLPLATGKPAPCLVHSLRHLTLHDLVWAAGRELPPVLVVRGDYASADCWERTSDYPSSLVVWLVYFVMRRIFSIRYLAYEHMGPPGAYYNRPSDYDVQKIPYAIGTPDAVRGQSFAIVKHHNSDFWRAPRYCVFGFDTPDRPSPSTARRVISQSLRESSGSSDHMLFFQPNEVDKQSLINLCNDLAALE